MQLSTSLSLNGWFLLIIGLFVFGLGSFAMIACSASALFLFYRAGVLIRERRRQL